MTLLKDTSRFSIVLDDETLQGIKRLQAQRNARTIAKDLTRNTGQGHYVLVAKYYVGPEVDTHIPRSSRVHTRPEPPAPIPMAPVCQHPAHYLKLLDDGRVECRCGVVR